MSEETEQPTPDVMEAWREWLTQTERQFNALFNQAMNTEPFGRNMGGAMEITTAFQRMMAEGMQRYLTFVNMPSRTDVTGLGETLRSIEDRLARIEEMLGELARLESETDDLARTSLRALFEIEGELGVGTVFWYQLIGWIADMADFAERVGNRIRLLIAT